MCLRWEGGGGGGAWHKLAYLRCHIILLYQLVPPCLYNPPRWEQTSRVATASLTPMATKQTILRSFNPNKECNYKIQLNLFTTAKVGIEESGRYKEVAVIERFKQESMYGLIVHQNKKTWPLVEVGLLVLQRCVPALKYICLYFLSKLSQKYFWENGQFAIAKRETNSFSVNIWFLVTKIRKLCKKRAELAQ